MNSPITMLFAGDFTGFLLNVLVLLPALLIAVSFHEASHAWMANRMGDPTARNLGRITLDPTKHLTVWGIVMFLFIGFGWGRPVPTNPRNYENYRKGNILVALAGVSMNMLLALVFLVIISILIITGLFNSIIPLPIQINPSLSNIVHNILFSIAFLNLILCFFNLIPIPPLDGHHLVKGVIARRLPGFYPTYMRFGFMALLLLFFVVPGVRIFLVSICLYIVQGVAFIFGVPPFGG